MQTVPLPWHPPPQNMYPNMPGVVPAPAGGIVSTKIRGDFLRGAPRIELRSTRRRSRNFPCKPKKRRCRQQPGVQVGRRSRLRDLTKHLATDARIRLLQNRF